MYLNIYINQYNKRTHTSCGACHICSMSFFISYDMLNVTCIIPHTIQLHVSRKIFAESSTLPMHTLSVRRTRENAFSIL